jgi:ABC-2 type transport system permease protein
MRNILTIAGNDLRILFGQRGTLLSLLAIPIGITIILGLVLSGNSTAGAIDVVRLDPSDPVASQFVDLLRKEGGSQFFICDLNTPTSQVSDCGLKSDAPTTVSDLRTEAETRIKDSASLSAIVLPDDLNSDLLAGKSTKIDFLSQGGLNAPALVQQKINAVLSQLNGTFLAARVAAAQVPADQSQAVFNTTYKSAAAIWATNPVVVNEQISGGVSANAQNTNGFTQSAPGMGSMFVLSSVLGLGAAFVTERKEWTLQRMMTTPVPRWQILTGKLLARYILGVTVLSAMLVVGSLFGVHWGDLGVVIAIMLTLVLALTAIALAFATMVESVQQAAGLALLLTLSLPPLGGAWWSLSIVPDWMRVIGHISPIAWSQDAFSALLFHNAHLLDVLPSLVILLLFAIVFFAFGLRRFRYI